MADLNNYLLKMAKRVARLEVKAEQLSSYIEDTDASITSKREEFREELDTAQDQVAAIRETIDTMEDVVTNMVNNFKQVARSEKLERVEDRIDDWQPEDCVTYDELIQALDRQ